MATLTCNGYLEFKGHAHSFLAKLPECNDDEADNGFKCLSLLYSGMTCELDIELDMAVHMLKLCGEKLTKHYCGVPLWDAR